MYYWIQSSKPPSLDSGFVFFIHKFYFVNIYLRSKHLNCVICVSVLHRLADSLQDNTACYYILWSKHFRFRHIGSRLCFLLRSGARALHPNNNSYILFRCRFSLHGVRQHCMRKMSLYHCDTTTLVRNIPETFSVRSIPNSLPFLLKRRCLLKQK